MPKIFNTGKPTGLEYRQKAESGSDKKEPIEIGKEYKEYLKKKMREKVSNAAIEDKLIRAIANKMKATEQAQTIETRKVFTTQKREQEMTIEQIAEILNNNKIDQIIVAGENRPNPETIKKDPDSKEKIFTLKPDLDAYTALYVLNNFNKKTPEETFSETSVISVAEKNGNGKDKMEEKKGGLKIFLDIGGCWMKVEKEGESTIVYIDHHGPGRREPTSGTKMMIEIMQKAGMLKELPPWLNEFTGLVNDIDNLSYIEKTDNKGRKIFTENYFRNEWPNSLYALAEKQIPYEVLIDLCKSGKITDMSKPFTKEELEGEIGNTKVGEFTIKELCQKQRGEVIDTLENGIGSLVKTNKNNGLNLQDTMLGKVIYQNYVKNRNGKINKVLDHLAFKATKAKGYDTYVSWNKKKESFYINSLDPNLSKIVEKLNEADPGCATDIRGVMVFGKIKGLSEEQFLDIINPKISKDPLIKDGTKDIKTSA